MPLDPDKNAAEMLVGETLPTGWYVAEKVERRPGDTGGNFSVNYLVERGSEKGFCKVLNLAWLIESGPGRDPASELNAATAVYMFERNIARECRTLSHVVTAIDDGDFSLPGFDPPLVLYIVFERAEQDVRRLLNATSFVDLFVKLRLLHNLAVGLRQLHTRGIAHQDVKPSNLLVYGTSLADGRGKLADLGRSVLSDTPGPYDDWTFAGDWTYAPPEVLYGELPSGFGPRRLASDLYQLAGMVSFCLTALTLNAHLKTELHPLHSWDHWREPYEKVLPYVEDAMGRAISRIVGEAPGEIRPRMRTLLTQLAQPDPRRRGDARAKGVESQYSLSRFVTELDLLASSVRLRGGL